MNMDILVISGFLCAYREIQLFKLDMNIKTGVYEQVLSTPDTYGMTRHIDCINLGSMRWSSFMYLGAHGHASEYETVIKYMRVSGVIDFELFKNY